MSKHIPIIKKHVERACSGRSGLRAIALGLTFLFLAIVIPVLTPAPACGDETGWGKDMEGEMRRLGISLTNVTEHLHLAWMPRSSRSITKLAVSPDGHTLWAATGNGVLMLNRDGQIEKMLLHDALAEWAAPMEKSEPPDKEDASANGDVFHRSDHSVITDLVPSPDGTLWAKGLFGAAQIDAKGEVICDAQTDRQAIEAFYDAIQTTPRLRQWYPTVGGHVYYPWAGERTARYDGKRWEFISFPGCYSEATGSTYHSPRQAVEINGQVYLAGEGGLVDVFGKTWLVRSKYSGIYQISKPDDALSIASDGGRILIITQEGIVDIGKVMGERVTAVWASQDILLLADVDASELGIAERTANGWSLRHLTLPGEHRWRAFAKLPAPPDGRTEEWFALTNNGVVQLDLANATTTEIVKIPVPKLKSPWMEVIYYGVHVNAAVPSERAWFLGTCVGLAKYELSTGKLTWVWSGN